VISDDLKRIIARLAQSVCVLEKAFHYIDCQSMMEVYDASLPYPIQEILNENIWPRIIDHAMLKNRQRKEEL
jgi:hypothetical protein